MNLRACLFPAVILFLVITIPVISAEPVSDVTASGVVIPLQDYPNNTSVEMISSLDIISLLNRSPDVNPGVPASFSLITVKAGESLSPDAVRPADEVIYLLDGMADINADNDTVLASAGDAVFVPAGSVLMVTNTGTQPLRFFFILSREESGLKDSPGLMVRPAGTVKPVLFGNESTHDLFEVRRILSPYEESLPLSFDLAIARLPAGNVIEDHFLESGQAGYVLSGEGNLSVNCTSGRITAGDLMYVPPGGVQRFEADTDLTILLITDPYYIPGQDYPAERACS